MNKNNWLAGTLLMYLSYMLFILIGLFIAPFWFKVVVAILLPIFFYFHIKEDYEWILDLMEKKEDE